MDRRTFLSIPCLAASAQKRPLRILLRSSWQSVNIGDIGHTPGALSLIEKHLPEAEVTLWPGKLGHGSRDLLTRGYPRLRIAESPEAIAEAKAWADIYVSGSGSGFPASQHAIEFHRTTGKPVGVLGVSLDPVSGFGEGRVPEGGTLRQLREKALALPPDHLKGDLRYILDRAAFFFCRDTITRDYLRAQRVKTPVLEFGPDAQLGMHLRDDSKGFAYLAQQGLEEGKFICVIPRLRYTPYYRIRSEPRVATDDVKDAINDRTTTADHAKLREMITAYVRQTGGKVMACAEMTYQVEMAKTELVDPLPPDVRRNIVWRDTYWLPDEAASIYAKALAVISVECHSPLIALRQGTPACYVRQPTDTCKGQMYRDVGADEWFFEIEEASGATLWAALERIVRNRKRAKEQARAVMARVEAGQKRMMQVLREGA
ncbi:MAG: polysaccharide pyruvyl transferase family protein [Bryobacteraceae bacterium]|nr:polysaccharide pyruvyl transferase family protein [Bryobacteraceae bacterium]